MLKMQSLRIGSSLCRSLWNTSKLTTNISQKRSLASHKEAVIEAEINDKPLPYIGSKAEKYKASTSRTGVRPGSREPLWYEIYVVIASTSIFLIYFLVLREENDIDQELSMPLYERLPELEKNQLLQAYEHNLRHGQDVTQIKARLVEVIRREKLEELKRKGEAV